MACKVKIYSKVYMEREDDTWCARPSRNLFERIINKAEGSTRWIASIIYNTEELQVAIGDPVAHNDERGEWDIPSLYVPQWLLESVGIHGDGDELFIRFERSENFPKATRLGFKVIGEIPEGFDLREILEEPLSSIGVLHEGQIIPAPVLEGVSLILEICEPEGAAVFLDGAEVALEISLDEAPPSSSVVSSSVVSSSVVSSSVPVVDESFPLLPAILHHGSSSSFIPFSGAGRRLCD